MSTPSNIAPGSRYRVYFTPLIRTNTYGSEVEVTNHITLNGINTIKRAVDSQDYEVGAYFYSDLEVIGSNDNGYFNESTDLRSIFTFLRDKTKVRIVFENTTGDFINYYGLINEEATRVDAVNETITFRILSRDSVIRNTQVAGGTISDGMTAKRAFSAVLNNPVITSVLTIADANINPSNNFTIDVGSFFDSMPAQQALTTLLFASNSVMTIDSSGNVIISSRAATSKAPLLLYGPYDIKRRQNIINIQNYNTGLQRMFTSVDVTDANNVDTVVSSIPLSSTYGFRQKAVDLGYVTDVATATQIANAVLTEFSVPKAELEVEVPTSVALGYDLLDRVSINWPLRSTPSPGKVMPVIGTATIGNTLMPLPSVYGSLFIDPGVAFKIIEINENPQTFTSVLKLRQIGTTLSDGYFAVPTSSVVGYAIIGIAAIGGTGDVNAQWNPSVLGAALIGATKIA